MRERSKAAASRGNFRLACRFFPTFTLLTNRNEHIFALQAQILPSVFAYLSSSDFGCHNSTTIRKENNNENPNDHQSRGSHFKSQSDNEAQR
jgi:hypothetical protein